MFCYCDEKIIRCLKSFDCLQVNNNVSLYLIQSVVALVRKKKKIFQMFIIKVLFLMFSYFSVFDKIWCTFFPEHFYQSFVWSSVTPETTLVSVSGMPGDIFCFCGMRPTVCFHVRFHGKKTLKIQLLHMNFCDWTDVQLASFLLHHLSYLIGWKVKDWNWFNYIQVLFWFIANMTLCSPLYLLLSLFWLCIIL